jgi:hypothetical protein
VIDTLAPILRRRRALYLVGVAMLLLILLLVTLVVARRSERESQVARVRPIVFVNSVDGWQPGGSPGIPPAMLTRIRARWEARLDAANCRRERKAAELDGRIDPVEAERIERFCGAL